MRTGLLVAAGVACACLAVGAAHADPCGDAQALTDAKVVDEASHVATPLDLKAFLPTLEGMLARAPATYPSMEIRGGDVLVHASSPTRAAHLSMVGLALAAKTNREARAFTCTDTYPVAALLIGAFWNEVRRPTTALVALDRAYAMQPDDDMVVTERGAALAQLRRPQEVLAMYDRWLVDGVAADFDRARILRSRGFALTELSRLDEAEADYRQSLVLEPNHAGALGELEYIAKLRAGGERGAIGLATVPDARTKPPTK